MIATLWHVREHYDRLPTVALPEVLGARRVCRDHEVAPAPH
jgi:hypothetical protein